MSAEQLLSEIQGGVRLRPAKTRDASAPVICADGERLRTVAVTPTTTAPVVSRPTTAPPPPPPPPLPTANVISSSTATTTAPQVDRDQLLNQIQLGVRLKKTATSDRSRPLVEQNRTPSDVVAAERVEVQQSSPKRSGLLDELVQNRQFAEHFKRAEAEEPSEVDRHSDEKLQSESKDNGRNDESVVFDRNSSDKDGANATPAVNDVHLDGGISQPLSVGIFNGEERGKLSAGKKTVWQSSPGKTGNSDVEVDTPRRLINGDLSPVPIVSRPRSPPPSLKTTSSTVPTQITPAEVVHDDDLVQEMTSQLGPKATRAAISSSPLLRVRAVPIIHNAPIEKAKTPPPLAKEKIVTGAVGSIKQTFEAPPPLPTSEPPPIGLKKSESRSSVSSLRNTFETSRGVKTPERKHSASNDWSPSVARKEAPVFSAVWTGQRSSPVPDEKQKPSAPIEVEVADPQPQQLSNSGSVRRLSAAIESSIAAGDSGSDDTASTVSSQPSSAAAPSRRPIVYSKFESLLPDVGRLTSRYESLQQPTNGSASPTLLVRHDEQHARSTVPRGSLSPNADAERTVFESSVVIRRSADRRTPAPTESATIDRPWLVKKKQIGNKLGDTSVLNRFLEDACRREQQQPISDQSSVANGDGWRRPVEGYRHLEVSDETLAGMTPEFMRQNFKFNISLNGQDTITFEKR